MRTVLRGMMVGLMIIIVVIMMIVQESIEELNQRVAELERNQEGIARIININSSGINLLKSHQFKIAEMMDVEKKSD